MIKSFVILLGGVLLSGCSSFYQIVNVSPSSNLKELSHTSDMPNRVYEFYYPDTVGNDYLRELRDNYGLGLMIKGETDDMGKIKTLLDWTRKQWAHNGRNSPTKQDALTILKEAKEGKQFRCVEYGIVASAVLNSVGLPSRTLGLKTRDVEKVMRGAGHVVTEVYSKDFGKWIFIDPQFNIIPTLNGVPLNGVEFQREIFTKNSSLKLINKQGELNKQDQESYIKWIGKYLFYFDVLFDQETLASTNYRAVNGMTKLTLVPIGYKEPRVFQRHSKINYSHYTNSLTDFYREPN